MTQTMTSSHRAHGSFVQEGTNNGFCFVKKAQILKILQAASSQQPVGFHCLVFHSFRWIPWDTFQKTRVFQVFHLSSMRHRTNGSDHKQMRINLDVTLTGFSVIFTLIDPVPQGLWASYHVFGLLSCGQGLCTAILTLTAAACVRTRL